MHVTRAAACLTLAEMGDLVPKDEPLRRPFGALLVKDARNRRTGNRLNKPSAAFGRPQPAARVRQRSGPAQRPRWRTTKVSMWRGAI